VRSYRLLPRFELRNYELLVFEAKSQTPNKNKPLQSLPVWLTLGQGFDVAVMSTSVAVCFCLSGFKQCTVERATAPLPRHILVSRSARRILFILVFPLWLSLFQREHCSSQAFRAVLNHLSFYNVVQTIISKSTTTWTRSKLWFQLWTSYYTYRYLSLKILLKRSVGRVVPSVCVCVTCE